MAEELPVFITALSAHYPDLKLTPSGNGWLNGCCPLHDESRPSFGINVEGYWNCFVCGGGTWLDLIRQLEGAETVTPEVQELYETLLGGDAAYSELKQRLMRLSSEVAGVRSPLLDIKLRLATWARLKGFPTYGYEATTKILQQFDSLEEENAITFAKEVLKNGNSGMFLVRSDLKLCEETDEVLPEVRGEVRTEENTAGIEES